MGVLEPFMLFEKKCIPKKIKMHPICYKTLCKYILKVKKYVKGKVPLFLPETFALVFDG